MRAEDFCVRKTFIGGEPADRKQLDYITSKEIKADKEAKSQEAILF